MGDTVLSLPLKKALETNTPKKYEKVIYILTDGEA